MGFASGALNFYPFSIRSFFHSTGNRIIKGWPPAVSIELIFRFIEGSVAAATNVGSFSKKVVVFTSERGFGAFTLNNAFFFGSKTV